MVGQSDWLPMMIATGLVMRPLYDRPERKARVYRNPPFAGKPIRSVNLAAPCWPFGTKVRNVEQPLREGENRLGSGAFARPAGRTPACPPRPSARRASRPQH